MTSRGVDPSAADRPKHEFDGAADPGTVVAQGETHRGVAVALRAPLPDESRPSFSDTPYNDFGPRLPVAYTAGVVHDLFVEVAGRVCGSVSWHSTHYGPNAGSLAWNIGIDLAPDVRGQGIGSTTQRLLAEYLLSVTPQFRVEASTDIANTAEQRALERAGFTREGILRGAQERTDGRHDLVCYSLLRDDLTATVSSRDPSAVAAASSP